MKTLGKLFSAIWFIAFALFFAQSFVPSDKKPELVNEYANHFLHFIEAFLSSYWFIIIFFTMSIFVVVQMGKDSGWMDLSDHFSRNYVTPKNSKFIRGNGYIGNISHNGILRVYVDELGIYLKVIFFFNIGHKPLMIPWEKISYLQPEQTLVSKKTPKILKKLATSFSQRKYMQIQLLDIPDQYIVIQWDETFNHFIPPLIRVGK